MSTTARMIIAGCIVATLILGFSAIGNSLEKEKSPVAPLQKTPSESQPTAEQKISPTFPDAGGSAVYDPGIDLVVLKVEMQRGIFMGSPKIQIIPTIKNMWKGGTSERIKIMFYSLDMAEWVEGGIGPNQEIRAGALYVDDPGRNRYLKFDVMVDNNNAIPETNEMNNRCDKVTLGPSEMTKVHRCRVVGPHEPLR